MLVCENSSVGSLSLEVECCKKSNKLPNKNMFKEYKIYKFCEQVKQETYKVVWPTRKELVASTLVVVAAVFIFSLICLVLDYSIHNIMQLLLNIGKQIV
ncbi:hypothetical protein KNCP2_13430 [Candidatus Rickettsia kedanie]|uniref:Protein translocase subunit SecE n=2 Tax=Candidatus Rickettsia kedanie TaxID=3115352 RepID=A0ABP9U1S1_9RICK